MKIKNLSISGTVLRVGDCVQDNPGVIIEDYAGNKIPLSLSESEVKFFATGLYGRVHLVFDAEVTITPSEPFPIV